jgi:hypothetical protein
MSEYDELADDPDEIYEILGKSKSEEEGDFKEDDKAEMFVNDETQMVGKLGESDEAYYRKKQAEAEAKGLVYTAGCYKEQADAAAIYEEIKD